MNFKSSLFAAFAITGLFVGALSAQADITTGLVGYWPLGDGPGSSNVVDAAGNGNAGTLTNFADHTYNNMWTSTTDPTNGNSYALSFNPGGHAGTTAFGTNTYVIVPDSTSLDLPSAKMQWTVSAWVYMTVPPSSEPNNAGIICKGLQNAEAYDIYMSGTNFATRFNNTADSGNEAVTTTNLILTANTWYNVTITVWVPRQTGSLAEALIYVNGSLMSPTNSNTYTTTYNSTQPLTIGCRANANGLMTNAFIGYIDQVRVYDRALSSNDVALLYYTNASQMAPFIIQQPVSATVAQGAAFTNNILATSTNKPTYQWFTNNVPVLNATNTQFIINPAQLSWNGISYYAVASNIFGTTTSSVVQLTVLPIVPEVINQLPITYTNVTGTNYLTLYSGASPSFSISAFTASPVNYFWFTNGIPVGGITASNFTWTNVALGSISDYCVVSNGSGMGTSMVWSASVLPDPTNSANGPAPYPQQVLALNPIGYWRLNEPDCCGGPPGSSGPNDGIVAHDYVGGNDGLYTNVVLSGPGYNSVQDPSDTSVLFGPAGAGFFNGCCANQIQGINFASPTNTSVAFTVEAWVSGYTQSKDAGLVTVGYNGQEQFDLSTSSDGGSTSHALQFLIRDSGGSAHTINSQVWTSTTGSQGPWEHVVGVVDEINTHTMTLYVNGQLIGQTTAPAGIGLLPASSPMSIGSRMSSATDTGFSDQYSGFMNDVAIFNYALSSNQVANEYADAGSQSPFFILPPPTNMALVAGTTLTIPVTAWGTGPLTNVWLDVNGNPIAASYGTTNGNAINALLAYNNVPGSWNGGQVTLTVSNAFGSTNFPVTLNVLTSPVITTNIPSQITLLQGQSYTYLVGVNGAHPLGYQWYLGGTGILNQTNAAYTLTASSVGTFSYDVTVTNTLGAVTSIVSTLTILPTPTTSYATNILHLNPVGYWPMHEIEAPAQGDIETNYGTLGLLGTGYYPDWTGPQGINRGFPGALANDPDTAVFFAYTGAGDTGSTTNCLIIPVNSTNAVLNPPFSVECWFWPTNKNQGDIWAQSGFEGLNAGNEGGGNGSPSGIRLYWGGNFSIYTYDNSPNLNGIESGNFSAGQWYHLVLTCDANTNMILYVNGTQAVSTNAVGIYSPDFWDPITIATGRGYTRNLPEGIDEFAVYTNVLTDISTHYSDGTGGSAGAYFRDVTNDHAVIYLRMDSSTYTPPAASVWPVLVNYASGGVNGIYTPGTMPGIAAGPVHANGLPINGLTGTSVAPLSGVSSYADAGFAAAYNPVGSNAFTMTAMFRGNPCDGRFQDIVGHSDYSWRIAMNNNGKLQCSLGQGAGVANSTGVYNDGNWHQVVDVYQPSSSPSVTGTNILYVDGALDATATGVSTNGIYPGTNSDVMIGAAPDYTNNPIGIGRQFDGQVCEVALFNAALTATQVQALYGAAGGVPASVNSLLPLVATTTDVAGVHTSFALSVGGTAPFVYKWYFNNTSSNYSGSVQLSDNATNITGSATAQLNVTNPLFADSGWYYAVANNTYGTATSQLAILTVLPPVNTTPTNIVSAITNNQLYLSWPADHTGWQLQALTNPATVGLVTNVPIGNNWANVNPSTGTNQVVIPINLTNGTVFYRLIYQTP